MKKFIITSSIIIVSIVCFFYVTYFKGFYIDFNPSQEIVPLFRTEEEKILRKDENGQWEQNTIFNEDGLPLDINGDVQDGEYRFKDDFDYSPFETDDE